MDMDNLGKSKAAMQQNQRTSQEQNQIHLQHNSNPEQNPEQSLNRAPTVMSNQSTINKLCSKFSTSMSLPLGLLSEYFHSENGLTGQLFCQDILPLQTSSNPKTGKRCNTERESFQESTFQCEEH